MIIHPPAAEPKMLGILPPATIPDAGFVQDCLRQGLPVRGVASALWYCRHAVAGRRLLGCEFRSVSVALHLHISRDDPGYLSRKRAARGVRTLRSHQVQFEAHRFMCGCSSDLGFSMLCDCISSQRHRAQQVADCQAST